MDHINLMNLNIQINNLNESIEAIKSAIAVYESKKLSGQAKVIVLNKIASLKLEIIAQRIQSVRLTSELVNAIGGTYSYSGDYNS
jgi:hypothetical protein